MIPFDFEKDFTPEIFEEYKDATQERRFEILVWAKDIIRKNYNNLPHYKMSPEEIIEGYKSLETFKANEGWMENKEDFEIGPIPVDRFILPCNHGVDLLYHYFPEVLNAKHKDHFKTMQEAWNSDNDLWTVLHTMFFLGDNAKYPLKWFYYCGMGGTSLLRPTSVMTIIDNIKIPRSNLSLLDVSAGYGSGLFASAFSNKISSYHGLDSNPRLFDCYKNAIKDLKTRNKDLNFYNASSEEPLDFIRSKVDIVFASPAVFSYEEYNNDDENQSSRKYKNTQWASKFFQPTIHNALDKLKDDGVLFYAGPRGMESTLDLVIAPYNFEIYELDILPSLIAPGAGEFDEYMEGVTDIPNNYGCIYYCRKVG